MLFHRIIFPSIAFSLLFKFGFSALHFPLFSSSRTAFYSRICLRIWSAFVSDLPSCLICLIGSAQFGLFLNLLSQNNSFQTLLHTFLVMIGHATLAFSIIFQFVASFSRPFQESFPYYRVGSSREILLLLLFLFLVLFNANINTIPIMFYIT